MDSYTSSKKINEDISELNEKIGLIQERLIETKFKVENYHSDLILTMDPTFDPRITEKFHQCENCLKLEL